MSKTSAISIVLLACVLVSVVQAGKWPLIIKSEEGLGETSEKVSAMEPQQVAEKIEEILTSFNGMPSMMVVLMKEGFES
jgi:hypothetical protein